MNSRLLLAIATFVLLDMGTLLFGFSISRQAERDAVAINLSGRQRMLSQRITKASLLATDPARTQAERQASAKEVAQAYSVFMRTLAAFAEGGETVGGDGRTVQLQPVHSAAAQLVGSVRSSLERWPTVPTDEAGLDKFASFMVERNIDILDAMNRLTTELERESIATVSNLRIAQTLAFVLSLVNFVFILLGMHRAQKRAETASMTDVLTGLLNRGGFYRELSTLMAESKASNAPLGVMLIDLNHFKEVNDKFGHAAGDDALREVGRRMLGSAKEGWVCGRLGGDEFAVICPGTDSESLVLGAEYLTGVLHGVPGGDMVISASVGYAMSKPDHEADELMALADAMMYDVKSHHYRSEAYRDRRP